MCNACGTPERNSLFMLRTMVKLMLAIRRHQPITDVFVVVAYESGRSVAATKWSLSGEGTQLHWEVEVEHPDRVLSIQFEYKAYTFLVVSGPFTQSPVCGITRIVVENT